jgi:internalin A
MDYSSLLRIIDKASEENWVMLNLSSMNLLKLPPEIGKLTNIGYLNISSNYIDTLPASISQLIHLRTLDIRRNQLNSLPESIDQLINLISLELSHNELTTLPKSIGQLKNLHNLDLSDNQLNSLPESIGQLINITSFPLWNNKLTTLPESIGQLKNIFTLDLSDNQLNSLPESIGQLKKLHTLNLSNNQLNSLPESMGQLENLGSLDLSDNQLTTLPESIGKLKNLHTLDLGDNQLSSLPESIGQLKNLTYIKLRGNQLTFLPGSIGQLVKFTSLDLSENKLTELPNSISQLINLISLQLWSNQLSSLPESIGQLKNLRDLDISENQLTILPESISQLENLDSLDLGDNQLTTLPESIGKLGSLNSLQIWSNQLTTLPESISQLENLTFLDLSENQLSKLPESIYKLKNLTSLYLSNNQLIVLPGLIGHLKKLVYLDLKNNKLGRLPESIRKLSKLKELILNGNELQMLLPELTQLTGLIKLDIRNNNLGELPPEIRRKYTQPGPVFNFLRQLQEEGSDRIYEAKLLIIGEGGSGKTSLANKLIDSNYPLKLENTTSPEKSTEGIDVFRCDFPHSSGNSFRINIWDFGGQEIYHATHQFFLTKRSLYLLVADTRQDNTDFNYWLEVVELLSEASPAIIVKNEKQDRPCQVNENQLRGRFPNLEKILPTNLACPNNRGLAEILSAVQHHISQLPHIGQPLPKTWVRVREALEAETRNYITQNEFLDLCDTHGFKRREDKLQLSGYLHDLGVCLHFQDDPILKNWIILKPEWGTTAVYKVLDTPKVQKALGCFSHKDLAEIWADDQYTEMRDELLQLMMRFKLCYEIPHRPRTYIAPQLLSLNQPEYTWDNSDNLILRYHYDFMPKGMLTRFTVEMHRLIDSDLVWKEGLILSDNSTRAAIIENYSKNEIRIRVSGFPKKDLLTRIRHEFDKIHNSYEKLRYQELIPCNCPTCKGSQTPHAYVLQKLQERIQNQAYETECDQKPYHKVNVHSLIDDSIGQNNFTKTTRDNRYTEKETSSTTITINTGNSTVKDQSQKTTNMDLRQANIGAIATDEAQATVTENTFTQNHNANTLELLQLITALRDTTAQLPPETQCEIIDDIDDLEIEIKKPEDKRNSIRLRKRLVALLTAATLVATPIAGMTDFTNNVLEIGNKLHIELPKIP